MEVSPFFRQQLVNGWSAQLVFARAYQPARLVQCEIYFTFCVNWPAINHDVVMQRVDLGAQLAHGLPVDADPAGDNQRFRFSPRADPRMSQDFL